MNEQLIAALETGLFLERRGVLLPWRAPLADVVRLGEPDVERHDYERSTVYDLRWPDEAILGSLEVMVSCTLREPDEARFEHAGCHLPDALYFSGEGGPHGGLEPELSHLVGVLGPPCRHGLGYSWLLPGLAVSLEFASLNEFHYGEDFRKSIRFQTREKSPSPGARAHGSDSPDDLTDLIEG